MLSRTFPPSIRFPLLFTRCVCGEGEGNSVEEKGERERDRDREKVRAREKGSFACQSLHLLRDVSIGIHGKRSVQSWVHPTEPHPGSSAGTGDWRILGTKEDKITRDLS